MTVAAMIRELQLMPNQNAPVPLRVDASSIDDSGAWFEERGDVDMVMHEGPFVALELR